MILNIPIAYTFKTRVGNYRALLGYLVFEVVPLLLAAQLSGRDAVGILLLYILWLDVYEIGYVFNDLKDQDTDGESNRTGSVHGSWFLATLSRLLFATVLSFAVAHHLGWRTALSSALLNGVLLLILLLHSSNLVRRCFPGRLLTFTALAIYKYAPVLIPGLPIENAVAALAAIFVFYGLGRILNYTLRKFGRADVSEVPHAQLKIQLGVLLIVAPLVLLPWHASECGILMREVKVLWCYFSAVAALSFCAAFLRRILGASNDFWSR
jgi:hypothetical protein